MYGIAAGHLAVGLMLPLVAGHAALDMYHRGIEAGFWINGAPPAARAAQIWWISLFGPTVQTLALWMGALIHIGDRQRSTFAWGWLIVGIVVWAPQDIGISLQAHAWAHVWIDCFAMITMLPPLAWLWRHDRRSSSVAG